MRLVILALLATVLLGGAVGTNWNSLSLPAGEAVQRVRFATLDDDADPDLLVISGPKADSAPNGITVWKGLGDGRFRELWNTVVTTESGLNGTPVDIGDLDLDGHADLVLANCNDTGGMTIRLGDGSGAFPTFSTGPSFGGYVDDLQLVLYDADDFLDLVEANRDLGYYVDRFGGDGDGTFNSNLPFGSLSGSGPFELAAGNLHGDGSVVEAFAGPDGLGVVKLGGGNLELVDEAFAGVIVPDLDGDGIDDVVGAATLLHRLYVVTSRGGGAYDPPVAVATGRRPVGLVATDLDLDGDLDVVNTNSTERSVSLLHNDGNATLTLVDTLKVGIGPIDVTAADVDLDGDADLAVANEGGHSVTVLLNPLH